MKRWGFVYTTGSESMERRVDNIGSKECELIAVGVASVDDGAAAAQWLREQGVELVEMCGAFGPPAQAQVATALAGEIPYGAVSYPCDQAPGLHRLFG